MTWLDLREKECYSLKLRILLIGDNVKVVGLRLLYMEKEILLMEWPN
jgi:hypothetical protein